ncbi:MAG: cytidylate kinase family protein [Patescibacteria group bacterium]
MKLKFDNITVSGKIAVGTTTLSKHLQDILGWKHINAGFIQREYDRTHNIDENKQGALSRSDNHEKEIDGMTKEILSTQKGLIYEAWLSGFMAQNIQRVCKVLLICSEEAVRIDRVVNRENITVEEAKNRIKQREMENIAKWKKLYGDYDFWSPHFYDLVIDTYSSGQMETVGKVLDKLGHKIHITR